MDLSNVVVVVPTIREPHINSFLDAWQWPCRVIVVEDNPERSFRLPARVDHYAWSDIERDLGAESWIIPRRTDCVRSYGYWKAYQTGAAYIVTLDDDCLPHEQDAVAFLAAHVANLQPRPIARWYATLDGMTPRGVPYEARAREMATGISHGLWRNVPDLDSLSALVYGRAGQPEWVYQEGLIPRGMYYPMCGMNLAWRREYTPLMYFGLQGQDAEGQPYPFDRFGDIWAGILSKKALDHLGVAVYSGAPYVNHSRASNVWANFDKEHAGIKANEWFWQRIDEVRLTGATPAECYQELATRLPSDTYWNAVRRAMYRWAALYE